MYNCIIHTRRSLLTAVILLFSVAVFAQTKRVSLLGRVHESGTHKSIEAAMIQVISGTDTLRAVSGGVMGQFIVKNVTPGNAIIRVSHLSYKTYEDTIQIQPNQDPLRIKLEPAVKELDEVTVKADIPLFKMSGDTLIYNAAAVKTLEGDDAIRIVEQLPGIILEGNRIMAMGKKVERTYIDGRLIFGKDPMAALLNLTASDVRNIKVYDEDNERNRKRKIKTDEKRRVLDIVTHSKLITATTGHFLASYGTDMEKDNKGELQNRYGVGATANFFSEKLLLSANAYSNNVNRTSNRLNDLLNIKATNQPYAENTYAAVGYEQLFGDERGISPELTADYSYKKGYTRRESYSSREYFPTTDYAERLYRDSLNQAKRTETHNAHASFSWKGFSISQDFTSVEDCDRSRQYSLSQLDATSTEVNSMIDRQSRNHTSRTTIGWWGHLSESWDLDVRANVNYEKNDGAENWVEDGSFQPLQIEYRSSPLGRAHRIGGETSLNHDFNNSFLYYFKIQYKFEQEYKKSHRLRYNVADGELDMATSRDYTYDYTRQTPSICFQISNGPVVALPVEISILNQHERLLESRVDRKSFVAVLPWVTYTLPNMGINSCTISYKTLTFLPSVEQLSEVINDSNPLYVSSGNPSLKQTYEHQLMSNFSFIKPNGGTWRGQVSASFQQNAITDRSMFYKDGTTLTSRNGYQVVPGGTFTTYENVSGKMMASVLLIYDQRVKFLKSKLSLSTTHRYNCNPTYVESVKNLTRTYTPSVSISLNTNFSRQIRFNVVSRNALIFSWNNVRNNNRYLREGVGCGLESNFAKYFFFNANYEYTLYKPLAGGGARSETNILNAVAGFKFLKNTGAVSISCYDLLNRGTAFKTGMYADYVRYSWTPTFGRYWSINLSYKFNKTKSGAKPSGMRLNDGGENRKAVTVGGTL